MRLLDFIMALLLIILFSPLYIIISVAILIYMGWPILFCAKRVGKNGKPYTHIKFRSMKPGKQTGRVFFEQDRITGLGKILRATHFDELPELWLILIGKNSFIGPRPLPQTLLDNLEIGNRQTVCPGWSCLAQLSLLRDGTLNKQRQIKLDLYYIKKRSLFYNCKILLATLLAIFNHKKIDLDQNSSVDRKKFQQKIK